MTIATSGTAPRLSTRLDRPYATAAITPSRFSRPTGLSDPDAIAAPSDASLSSAPAIDADSSDSAPADVSIPSMRPIEDDAAAPLFMPSGRDLLAYDTNGRLIVPMPLYGSREVLMHQNLMADHDGLNRVQDDAGLLDLRREKKLVALPESEALRVDFRLPENRRFSRPWTAEFLAALARDHYASFHLPIQVDSAVRTIAVQRRLLRTNGNAAPIAGDTASPHLTGQAIDIAKSSLSLTEIAWMRAYLQPLIDQGKIDVEEEFKQACFHISVYKSYLPAAPAHPVVAAVRETRPASAN